MFLIPLAAGIVGVIFGALVLRQFAARRHPYQAAWGFALVLFGLAALAEAAGAAAGWTPGLYRFYYLLGGILNVGWLGAGTVYLLAPRRWGHAAALLMAAVTLAAIPAVMVAPVSAQALAAAVPGRGAIGMPAVLFPAFTNIAGSVVLIGGAAWSAWRAVRRGGPLGRTVGTALIAAGAFVIAGTHSVAQVRGIYAVQPVGEAAGIVVMFAGYLAVESRAVAARGRAVT